MLHSVENNAIASHVTLRSEFLSCKIAFVRKIGLSANSYKFIRDVSSLSRFYATRRKCDERTGARRAAH